jgi:hypothetical protein
MAEDKETNPAEDKETNPKVSPEEFVQKKVQDLFSDPDAIDPIDESKKEDLYSKVPKGMLTRVEKTARFIATKMAAPKFLKLDLARQSNMLITLTRVYGVDKSRSSMYKNLPGDLKRMKKKGATDDEIIQHYMGCPEFKKLWTEVLGLDEKSFKALLPS